MFRSKRTKHGLASWISSPTTEHLVQYPYFLDTETEDLGSEMICLDIQLLFAAHLFFQADFPRMSRCPSAIAGPPLQAIIMKINYLFNTDGSGTVPGIKNMYSVLKRHTI